ncbi:metal-dependent hydrolase [Salmonella enterica subsp. salamae]|uniref:Deoxyribonuclease YjjV n=3 Tax=Salmonella enterica TaxID=28901 RepID=A0A379QRD7_SALER|nr:metal-dependent hydrolase [Salmonella enterica]ECC1479497.1 metal-dependent hydrolase [Salmonella enterica subsp. salamae]EHM1751750.1 metal-dependent hydrolase [Salmonella enterica subsp. salamae serovar 40:c:e,n,x,z15]HCM1997040.1 metal-dependent hydrolase [Salmonella enterica subsp. salamae serovar [1],40:z35:e,n,x,z15]ASG89720.1 metal-dependent hydrolase [Salmonella enterica subsp. salamae serovar 55:k:z39 str. 1315K]ECC1657280.1 metal-dependent hydrolase [Salmonella enterica subsp. sal
MSRRFIDTHCHFDFPPFTGDERASIQRAADAGVEKIIVPATEAPHFPRVLALAARFPPLYAALGLHPIVIERHADDDPDKLQQTLAQQQNVVAVGEIGLDLYRDDPQFARQERFFDVQLRLAKRYDLPVILHSRRTHDKLAMHLKQQDLPRTGVVHGFAGSLQQAERFVQLGYKIGVGGTITWPRASKTRDVMARLPLDALLLETDAPDMPLKGFQGQPNRPEQAARVFDALCELRPEPAEVIADALYRNTITLFRL